MGRLGLRKRDPDVFRDAAAAAILAVGEGMRRFGGGKPKRRWREAKTTLAVCGPSGISHHPRTLERSPSGCLQAPPITPTDCSMSTSFGGAVYSVAAGQRWKCEDRKGRTMKLSQRSKLSLCQFLRLFPKGDLTLLLGKYEWSTDNLERLWDVLSLAEALKEVIVQASDSQLQGLVIQLSHCEHY